MIHYDDMSDRRTFATATDGAGREWPVTIYEDRYRGVPPSFRAFASVQTGPNIWSYASTRKRVHASRDAALEEIRELISHSRCR